MMNLLSNKIIALIIFVLILSGCSMINNHPNMTIEQHAQNLHFFVKQTMMLALYNTDYPESDWINLRTILEQGRLALTDPEQVDLNVVADFFEQDVPEEYQPMVAMILKIVEQHIYTITPTPDNEKIIDLIVAGFDGAIEAIDEYLDN